jgi:8-oxo-dGTP diphosphatase
LNSFESGERKAIPAVLVYPRRGADVLMLHRNAKAGDYHAGKWNGLGGKLEPDESPLEAARRELREESGLDLADTAFRPLGVLTFPLFKAHKGEDWIVWVYSARVPAGVEPLARGPEGDLRWIPAAELSALNLWAGDRHFIGFVAEERPFQGTIWYRGEEVVRYSVQATGS